MKKTVVINMGGSIISPKPAGIDLKFIKKFKAFLQKEKNYRFIIVIGGGKTARSIIDQAKKMKIKSNDALDWLGIRSTRINAEFLRAYLGSLAPNPIVTIENLDKPWKRGILVSGGWHPGNSTDYVSAALAVKYKAEKVIVATNIDYIYNKDPNKYKDAVKFKELTWKEYNKICGGKWTPGMTTPLDPKAAKLSQKKKLTTKFLRGTNLNNLKKALHNESFKGTTVF